MSFVPYCSDAELPTPEQELQETRDILEKEKQRVQQIRLQLAKKNRAIVSIERQLDNIPDRTELTQYQRRFIELYNQGSQTISNRDDFGLFHAYFSLSF